MAFSDNPAAVSKAGCISVIFTRSAGILAWDANNFRVLACSINGVALRFFSNAKITKPDRVA